MSERLTKTIHRGPITGTLDTAVEKARITVTIRNAPSADDSPADNELFDAICEQFSIKTRRVSEQGEGFDGVSTKAARTIRRARAKGRTARGFAENPVSSAYSISYSCSGEVDRLEGFLYFLSDFSLLLNNSRSYSAKGKRGKRITLGGTWNGAEYSIPRMVQGSAGADAKRAAIRKSITAKRQRAIASAAIALHTPAIETAAPAMDYMHFPIAPPRRMPHRESEDKSASVNCEYRIAGGTTAIDGKPAAFIWECQKCGHKRLIPRSHRPPDAPCSDCKKNLPAVRIATVDEQRHKAILRAMAEFFGLIERIDLRDIEMIPEPVVGGGNLNKINPSYDAHCRDWIKLCRPYLR